MEFADSYPKAWENPIDIHPSATLEAAGAWTPVPVVQNIFGARGLTLTFTYTRNAVGGGFDYRVELSPYSSATLVPAGANEWSAARTKGVGVVAFGADTQNREQRDFQTFGSQAAPPEGFQAEIELQAPYERIRIIARESGDGVQASPGDLQVTMVVW